MRKHSCPRFARLYFLKLHQLWWLFFCLRQQEKKFFCRLLWTEVLQNTKDFIKQLRKNIKDITMSSFISTYFLIKIKFRYRLCLVDKVLMTPMSRTVLFLLHPHLWTSLYSRCHPPDDALFTCYSNLYLT